MTHSAPFSNASLANTLPLKLGPYNAKKRQPGVIFRVSIHTIGCFK